MFSSLVSFDHGPGWRTVVAELALEGLQGHLVNGLVVNVQQVLVDEPVAALAASTERIYETSRVISNEYLFTHSNIGFSVACTLVMWTLS